MPLRSKIKFGILVIGVLACTAVSRAQEAPAPNLPDQPAPSQGVTMSSASTPCVKPPPMVRLEDYDGPFAKTLGFFTGKIEGKTVHPPHYKPGLVMCTPELKDKFLLFVRGSYDPGTVLNAGFNSGLSQALNQDPTFGQGMGGYGKRFGAAYADQVSFAFFKDFAYPSIFGEDPRYYRLIQGSGGKRVLHALEHAFVTHSDRGKPMFNFSEWLGTTSEVSLSNLYHPGNARGFVPSARNVGYSVLTDMGFDILREFWPEITHKLRLPFRDEPQENIETVPANP